jgi:hypothetical protein
MAGTIEISSVSRWSAASWLFDWVLRSIAATTNDPKLAAELLEIVEENLGWLTVGDLEAVQKDVFFKAVSNSLLVKADAELPDGLPDRQGVVELLRELVDIVRKSTDH